MEKLRFYAPGETVIREGEQGDGFYILKEGTLEVLKDRIIVATITEPGTIFGEMSDILNEPRTCTVVAKSGSRIVHIPKGIDVIIAEYPSVAKKLIVTLAKRLEDTTKTLLVFKADEK